MSPHARALSHMAVKSMKKAVLKVVEEHKKEGRSLSVWKDGKVIQVPAKLYSRQKKSTSNRVARGRGK